MKRKITLVISAAALLTTVLIAAGCGSSAGGSAYGSGQPPPAAKPSGAAKVGVADSALGRIIVNNAGLTLYVFEKDENGRSACSGQCARYWPPLLTNAKPVALVGVAQSLLGTTRRANGTAQVTYAGHPLYRFFEDRKPGETKGEGSQDFGAEWDVLSPAGEQIEADD
jgi:predicted lipoprotein with Yx(FWY)xxD motif